MKHISLTLLLFMSIFMTVRAQRIGVKTNLLYWGTTTPNIGLEFRTGDQFTLSLHGGYNPFNFGSHTKVDGVRVHPKLRHWLVMPEVKYWFCQAFERGYVGIHGVYGEYNVGGISLIKDLKNYRYQGNAYGGGVSMGYQWALGDRWGVEASLGVGYLRLNYKKYDCGDCGDFLGEYKRNYFGPTKAVLSLIYYLK
ncbi:DUF3575 domain-containing protein [Porphyromonas pogonae]|uniref:DUF3575 domain-containing protein n=1 Tax=Porphyromonas pogonae TaxID=867595 RepID=UPI002E79AD07|nr:DUF3575 domain-containing protein [Porphyromonas pogonae]